MSTLVDGPTVARADLRTLLVLAWPVVLARSTQAVVGVCDAAMTAPLGERSLAAVTTGSLNSFSFVILPMGTVLIVQSFTSQLYGQGRITDTRRFAWYGLMLAGVALALGLAAIPCVDRVLGWLDYEPEVHRLMVEYLEIRLWGVGAVAGMEALGNWFAGLGKTHVQMRAGVVVMIANVLLNWILIYGHLGAPALGVRGAALASALAPWLGFALVAALFRAERSTRGAGPLGLDLAELGRVVRFGLPNGINWFMEFAAFTAFVNVVVAPLGTTALAALNVIFQINTVSFMPAFGLATAGAILAGHAIGRRALDEVWPSLRRTAAVTLAWQGSVGLVYVLAPGILMAGFAPGDAGASELVAIGSTMLMISGIWQVFDAVGLTFGETLRAAGDTTWCMWARLITAWTVFLPVAWLAVHVWEGGTRAAAWCICLYLMCLAALLVRRFFSGAWRTIDLTGHQPAPVP